MRSAGPSSAPASPRSAGTTWSATIPEVIADGTVDAVALRRRHRATGAQELARSAVGPQAWRLGRSFCTQFHPEATETMIRRWAAGAGGDELAESGIKPDELIDDARRNVAESRPAAEHIVDWFLDRVAGS